MLKKRHKLVPTENGAPVYNVGGKLVDVIMEGFGPSVDLRSTLSAKRGEDMAIGERVETILRTPGGKIILYGRSCWKTDEHGAVLTYDETCEEIEPEELACFRLTDEETEWLTTGRIRRADEQAAKLEAEIEAEMATGKTRLEALKSLLETA